MSCSRVKGQKLSSRSPCVPALPGTYNWISSPHTVLLTSPCNAALCIVAVGLARHLSWLALQGKGVLCGLGHFHANLAESWQACGLETTTWAWE
eukprot:scaffold139622_cov19-Tisochrysis_lutea.AAC.1